MSLRKEPGFTLIEIVVVLIIIGVLTVIVVPALTMSFEQARARDAQNNLMAIYAAQLNYFNNHGYYCNNQNVLPDTRCDTTARINLSTSLGLNIITNGFDYACTGASTATFSCTATRQGNSNFVLTLSNAQIVLTGSGTHNPLCSSTNNPAYCNNV